ncbi:hypothetical protein LMCDFJHI_01365 [Aeromonas salmonicida]
MTLSLLPRWLKTKVRWRLLLLTSVPIMLTLVGMMGLTLYWTLTYSWQNLLTNVRGDLGVAHHAVSVQQQRQAEHLEHLRDAWAFQLRLRETPDELQQWVKPLAANYDLDFLRLRSGAELDQLTARERATLGAGRSISHFVVWSREELQALSPALASRAVLDREQTAATVQETRGLVSLSMTPVMGRDGSLWAVLEGGELINGSTRLVDELKRQVFAKNTLPEGSIGTVTLFLDDLRVSTNVPVSSSRQVGRAVGTRVSAPVREQVLGRGELWIDRAFVHDAWYVSGYEPLLGARGERIGMLYVGFLEWPIIRTYLTNLLELGSGVVLLLLLSGLLVYRGARDLFTPIERMHKVVRQVQYGQSARVGQLALDPDHELAQLGRQFDAMLDRQDAHRQQMARSADELEQKVAERTLSLKQKTAELEHHIHMLTQARQQLLISEKLAALGELCAGVAHVINNPLAVILGNVELMKLELGEAAAPVSEELALVLAQIERIRAITRSLLQYSRPGDRLAAPHPHHRREPDPGALRPAPAAGEPGGRSAGPATHRGGSPATAAGADKPVGQRQPCAGGAGGDPGRESRLVRRGGRAARGRGAGHRQWQRHRRRHHGQDLRPLLHHPRHRHRPWAGPEPPYHQPLGRGAVGGLHPGERKLLYHTAAQPRPPARWQRAPSAGGGAHCAGGRRA